MIRRTREGPQVALIARQGREGKIWCLPKGLMEKGESAEETALREVQEETGLTGKLLKKVGEITYWYASRQDKKRYFKKVSFFALEHTGGDTKKHDAEVEEVGWFPFSEAILKLAYPTERKIVEKAKGLL